jgi:aldehyde:ferredoxin oxidoreductase
MRGDPAYFELLGVPVAADPHTWEDKPPLVAKWQDVFCVIDAAGLCVFFSVRYLVEQNLMVKPLGITELLNAATGAGYTPEEVERIGERIFNAERLFLLAAGFTRQDDTLPPRIIREPMPAGPAKGMVCRLEEMLEPYYRLRGWSAEGVPSEAKLKELGLW